MEYSLHDINITLEDLVHELGELFQSEIVTQKVLYGLFFFRSVTVPICAYIVRVPIAFVSTFYILLIILFWNRLSKYVAQFSVFTFGSLFISCYRPRALFVVIIII